MAWIPAAIGGATSLIGGLIGGNSAKKAADILYKAGEANANQINTTVQGEKQSISDATMGAQGLIDTGKNEANQALEAGFNRQQDVLNPYIGAGQQGVMSLQEAMQPGGALAGKFTAPTADEAAATPGFQFQLQQGNQALQRAASAAGQLMSGGTLKSAAQYGQGLASTYYQNAFNNSMNAFQLNRNSTLGNLMALTDLGKFGTSQFNAASQNYGNSTAQNLMRSGELMANTGVQGAQFNANLGLRGVEDTTNLRMQGAGAQASGTVASGNAWQNMLGQLGYAGASAASSMMGIKNPYDRSTSGNPLGTQSLAVPLGATPSYDTTGLMQPHP
jgi:hypothetical protein